MLRSVTAALVLFAAEVSAQCTEPCPLADSARSAGACDFQVEGSWSLDGSVTQISAVPGDTLTAFFFLRDELGAPTPQHVCGFRAELVGSDWLTLVDVLADQGLQHVYQTLPLELHGPQGVAADFWACDAAAEPTFFFALVVVVSEEATAGGDWLAFWPEDLWAERFQAGIVCDCLPDAVVCATSWPVLPPEFLEIQIETVATGQTSWGDTKSRY